MSTAYYMLTQEKADALKRHTEQIRGLRQRLNGLQSATDWYSEDIKDRFKEESDRLMRTLESELTVEDDIIFIVLSGNKIQWATRESGSYSKDTLEQFIQTHSGLTFFDEYNKEIALDKIKEIILEAEEIKWNRR